MMFSSLLVHGRMWRHDRAVSQSVVGRCTYLGEEYHPAAGSAIRLKSPLQKAARSTYTQ